MEQEVGLLWFFDVFGNSDLLSLICSRLNGSLYHECDSGYAAKHGHLNLIIARGDGSDSLVFSKKTMDTAAKYGHLNIVQYLHIHRTEGCTTEAMDKAAKNGHLHVVQWLHTNRKEGCTDWNWAMGMSAAYGHLETAEWLFIHRKEDGCTHIAMESAAAHGHLDSVKWLHRNIFTTTNGILCNELAMDYAALSGHLHIVKWLHTHRTEGCTHVAMDYAAAHNHMDVVQWLHENRDEGCSFEAILFAIRAKHVDMAKWLYTNRHEARDLGSRQAELLAMDKGLDELAQWLHDKANWWAQPSGFVSPSRCQEFLGTFPSRFQEAAQFIPIKPHVMN